MYTGVYYTGNECHVKMPCQVLIKIQPNTKESLERLKIHPRQSYGEVVLKLLDFYLINFKDEDGNERTV